MYFYFTLGFCPIRWFCWFRWFYPYMTECAMISRRVEKMGITNNNKDGINWRPGAVFIKKSKICLKFLSPGNSKNIVYLILKSKKIHKGSYT